MITLALSVKPCPQPGQKGNVTVLVLKAIWPHFPWQLYLIVSVCFLFLELYRPISAINNYRKMPVKHLPNRNSTVQKNCTTTCPVKTSTYMLYSWQRSDPRKYCASTLS